MHYMAFVITDVMTDVRPNTSAEPPTSDIREAAHQAVQIALHHIEQRDDSDDNYPESLDIGGYQAYAYIQGRYYGDYRPPSEECCWAFWSQRSGRKEQPLEILEQVMMCHWNNSSDLIKLALQSPPAVPHREWIPLVPQLVLFPDREPTQLVMQYLDVFGEDQDAFVRPNIAAQHLTMDNYSQAHHLAKAPMDALNRAQHRIDYVRAVAPYRDRITIQLDWNL